MLALSSDSVQVFLLKLMCEVLFHFVFLLLSDPDSLCLLELRIEDPKGSTVYFPNVEELKRTRIREKSHQMTNKLTLYGVESHEMHCLASCSKVEEGKASKTTSIVLMIIDSNMGSKRSLTLAFSPLTTL